MRCFYVVIHGILTWDSRQPEAGGEARAGGFYCHRYVLAQSEEDAAEKAFRRVRENLDKQTSWLRDGLARLAMDAEELAVAPMHKLLERENRGHTFYAED